MRRPVGVKCVVPFFAGKVFVLSELAAVAMLPFALSRSDSFARCTIESIKQIVPEQFRQQFNC